MASLIPQGFIDDLLDRLDIVEVVDSRVKLKKTGKNFSACCPFHDEKTPSFTVSQDKQFYHCFGCGASGNTIGFLMNYERMEFPQAVENLARLAGLEVPREKSDPAADRRAQEKRRIYELLEQTDEYFQTQLRQHPARLEAVNYLKNRGLSGTVAREFGIGFAPPGWDNLLQTLGNNTDDRRRLNDAGMFIEKEGQGKFYDRFRHRIMFPIRDVRGRVIGFGGRVLGDDKPKYLNSPETPVFHKGKELYGLHEARQAYKDIPRLLVVEGYMDVVALAQFDIRYAVATLGTACGEDHLNRAFRYTNEVVFCFDGDAAGRAAGRRALENTLPAMQDGRQVKFLFLPDGEDPDTLVRQVGAEKFTQMIALAVPLEDFLFDAVADGIDISSMEGRARLSKLAAPLLDKLPKGVFRELMFDNLASRTGLNKDTLMELIKELPKQQRILPDSKPGKNQASSGQQKSPQGRATKSRGRQAHAAPNNTNPAPQARMTLSPQGQNQRSHGEQGAPDWVKGQANKPGGMDQSGGYKQLADSEHSANYDHSADPDHPAYYDHSADSDYSANYSHSPDHALSSDYGHMPDYDQLPDYSGDYGDMSDYQEDGHNPGASSPSSRYLMPPKRKIIALTLCQPELAASVENHEHWETRDDPELKLFGRLVKLLKQRPHYKLPHLIGFWSASYGEEETQYLKDIASKDLVQATRALAGADEEDRGRYDLAQAFTDTLAGLERLEEEEKRAQSLEKLKNSDLTQLSREDKQRWVEAALAGKLPKTE